MTWTRRRFVTRAAAGAAGLSLGPRVWAADLVEARVGEFPLAGLVTPFRGDQARAADSVPSTGMTRDAYLDVIGGIVRFFAAHQDARGAIIDPYERAEKQYSTPAFALAGAVLLSARPGGCAAARRRARDVVRLRVPRRREGGRRPRRTSTPSC